MTKQLSQEFSLKGSLFFSRIKTKNPWGVLGKFKSICLGPYVVSKVLKKGAYQLTNFDGNEFLEPRNGLYLKKYYA